jgi:uncharacterized protein involved in exopolysaccharide biosynthesis
MFVGLLMALTTPNQFRSIGKLLVRPGIREATTPEAALSGKSGSLGRSSVREGIQNELQVLSTPVLFEKVVERCGAGQILAPYDPMAGKEDVVEPWYQSLPHAFQTWWFQSGSQGESDELGLAPTEVARLVLANRVIMYAERETNVITVEYQAHSPELAREVIDATLSAAIDVHRDVFNASSSLDAVEKALEEAEVAALDAEEKLRDFRKVNGIYDHEVQRSKLLDDLGALRRQVDSLEVDVERKKAEIGDLNKLHKSLPKDRVISGSPSFILNPSYASLSAFLLQLRQLELSLDAEKTGMSTGEYQSRSKRLTQFIDEIRTRLNQQGLQLKVEVGREENPYYQSTQQDIDARSIEVKGLAKQKQGIAELCETIDGALAAFEAKLPTLSALMLDAGQKRDRSSRLADSVASMQTAQRLEQLNLSNIQVMHAGTFEPVKVGPKRGKQIFLIGLAGSVGGAMLALLLAWSDRRIRGPHDLLMLGVPEDAVCHGEALRRTNSCSKETLNLLPPEFREVGGEIARFWSTVPYDRRSSEGLKIAFVPCDKDSNASLAAATLAIGLSTFGGERVVYVSCASDDNWLSRRLGFADQAGWSEVVRNGGKLEDAVVATTISGLSYLPMGQAVDSAPHPIAGPAFVDVLEQLSASNRFVVLEMPDPSQRPEGQSVLCAVDAAQLVMCIRKSTKASVREGTAAIKSANARLLGAVLQSVSSGRLV